MSTLAVHLAISLFVIAACYPLFKNKDWKYVAIIPIIALFGLGPDLDCFIGLHRVTFHNIFAVLIVSIPLIICLILKIFKKKNIGKKKALFGLILGLFVLHILLDMSCGGVSLLYPASNDNYKFDCFLGLSQKEINSTSEHNHKLSTNFKYNKPGDEGMKNFVITPRKSIPRIYLIANATELLFLITSILVCIIRFYPKKN